MALRPRLAVGLPLARHPKECVANLSIYGKQMQTPLLPRVLNSGESGYAPNVLEEAFSEVRRHKKGGAVTPGPGKVATEYPS
jgi:hypothetical protein